MDMYMVDFSFAGKRLSDYGCIVASIVTSNSDNVSLGSNIRFETLKNSSTFTNRIVKIDYEEPTPISFDICKDPCKGTVFEDTEISFLMRWLNKKTFEKFQPIYDDASYPNIYFKGSFNVTAICVGGDVVGLTLTFTPNSPFGYENEKEIIFNIDVTNNTFTFFNTSDECGYLYPTQFVITCKSNGNFEMINDIDNNNIVRINNCMNGEVITLDCYNKIIQSSEAHIRLYNDFNYNYPRFTANDNANKNVFTISLSCEIKIIYSSIRKAGIIV